VAQGDGKPRVVCKGAILEPNCGLLLPCRLLFTSRRGQPSAEHFDGFAAKAPCSVGNKQAAARHGSLGAVALLRNQKGLPSQALLSVRLAEGQLQVITKSAPERGTYLKSRKRSSICPLPFESCISSPHPPLLLLSPSWSRRNPLLSRLLAQLTRRDIISLSIDGQSV
jgi:hypothetical protein